MLIHEPLSLFFIAIYLILIIFQGVLSFSRSQKLKPLEKDRDFQRSSKCISYSHNNMYDIDNALSWEFRGLITRESETILPLFLSYVFVLVVFALVWNKNTKPFYRSSIINAGLLRDLS